MGRQHSAIIIFGSKVNADGKPSKSLLRRTLGALEYANAHSLDAYFVVSGGLGDHPPAEAIVMKDILVNEGVKEENILLDEDAFDTFDTVINCKRILMGLNVSNIFVCSDDYHIPRCLLLMNILYKKSKPVYVDGSRKANGNLKWMYYCVRETVATIWDVVLALKQRAV